MTNHEASTNDAVWTAIRREQRRDRVLRAVSITAWSITLLLLLVYAAMVASDVSQLQRLAAVGVVQEREVVRATIPLIAAIGTVMLLIATLSTVGVFLRMRTATLTEIQLRLAALESMLGSMPDADA
jgi:hypothetical protein